MKKIYISVPMRGRTDEAIKASFEKMKQCAEVLLHDFVDVVNPFPPQTEDQLEYTGELNMPKDLAIRRLGLSISLMGQADYVVCVDDWWGYHGCAVESLVRQEYHIPKIGLPVGLVCPDIDPAKNNACVATLYANGEEFMTIESPD